MEMTAALQSRLVDIHGRTVRYLRLSVTDRCNLRCLYCTHALGLTFIPHENILTYEEMLALIDASVSLGIDKVRLTGGEPFVRKGFVPFLRDIRRRHSGLDLRITTNATLLAPHVPALKEIGINTINISFDTFSPETFERISGRNDYDEARRGLDAALSAGIRVKINAVALKGVNDAELPSFMDFARQHPVDVRFIEFMPLGGRGRWTEDNFWPAAQILEVARAVAVLTPVERGPKPAAASDNDAIDGAKAAPLAAPDDHSGPARMFTIEGGMGRFGLITPLSNHFCGSCNRLRITSDGRLRTCLFSDNDHPFLHIVRDQAQGIAAVKELMASALRDKPMGYKLLQERKNKGSVIERGMSSIGG